MQYPPPMISVLTPVYNGERYLAECIESVRAQTCTDWEYIIVDNCSKDGSAELAERYAATDKRIRVVRCTEFVNVHRNFSRSARLTHPGSKYCKFLAADDWMYPECLARMVSVAERHPTVGIVSSYRLEGNDLGHGGFIPYTLEVVPGVQVIRAALLDGQFVTGSPSQLLYRADLVRDTDPFFDQSVWHSDTHAAYRTLLGWDLGFVHQVLTYTRLHPKALTAATQRVNTHLPNEIRFRIEFGRKVLTSDEYRKGVRALLRRYAWYLLKQYAKPSRWNDAEFYGYHREEILRMLVAVGDDRETKRALTCLYHLIQPMNFLAQPTAQRTGGDLTSNAQS
jgi:glycosyltransferase involved in cell wall biosynthesis